jgi:glycosyltransferase involved in cell wall biosynthesis
MSVFNSEPVLEDALSSILGQTEGNFEFVIVDDGSSDGSSSILDSYARQDPRIKLVRQPNQGLTNALIRGCAMARGEFIARQDSDDVSMPTRLETLLKLIRTDDSLAFVSSWAEVMGPAGETLLVHRRPTSPKEARQLLLSRQDGPPGHGSVMFRRSSYERVGGYRREMYFAQDSDLWLRLIQVGGLAYADKVLYKYRVAPESISGRLQPVKLAFSETVTELHEARLAGRDEAPILARAAELRKSPAPGGGRRSTSQSQTSYFIARCLIKQGDPRALSYLRRSISEKPMNPRAWASLPQAALLHLLRR